LFIYANEGELSIAFHDDAPKVRLECNVCEEFHNYYDFHK
jgi:hypothetical protein